MCLVRLGLTWSLAIPDDTWLSVCIGVGSGCGWPISSRMFLITTVSRALWKSPAVSASVADDMMLRRILDSTCMLPLGFGGGALGSGLSLPSRKTCISGHRFLSVPGFHSPTE